MQHYSPSDGLDFSIIFDEIELPIMDKKIKWVQGSRRYSLVARTKLMPRGWEIGVSESDMDPVQQWCEERSCGRRISFDTFQFKNQAQITMFLLRWG